MGSVTRMQAGHIDCDVQQNSRTTQRGNFQLGISEVLGMNKDIEVKLGSGAELSEKVEGRS